LNIRMDPKYAEGFKSRCQIARKVTERWAEDNLYCMACSSNRIAGLAANSETADFTCKNCSAKYELKSMKKWNERCIVDSGYDAMIRSLKSDTVPNLLVMQYNDSWLVQNLMLVPSFFFSPAAVQKRNPLAATARRAGWVGCNILLSEIAAEGKIRIISNGSPSPPSVVRERYEAVRPLASIRAQARGWTLDVLRMVRRLGQKHFTLQDIYAFEDDLSAIHPGNQNVRPKIRQQLQVLRDLGFIRFMGRGKYEMARPHYPFISL
jgi:type II restriction enzyme